MDDQTRKTYHNIICDAWDLLKVNLNKVYYEELAEQTRKLDEKYHDTEQFTFAADIIVAVLEEINRLHDVYGDRKESK